MTTRQKLISFFALACCVLMAAAAFGQSAPFGYVDTATDINGNTTIPYNGNVIVSGWAADNEDTAPVTKVEIFIDGKLAGTATLGGDRADVATYFNNPAFLKSGWTATIGLASYGAGPHTVSAVATDSTNLTSALNGTPRITVTAPDLSAGSLSVTGTAAAGATISVTETTTNVGSMAAVNSMTRYYLSTSASKGGTLLGGRWAGTLNAGAGSTATTSVKLPASMGGSYYLVACANDTSTVVDKNTANNCVSTPLALAGPDLAATVTGPATGIAGGTVTVSSTVTNIGSGAAGFSITRFYLSATTTKSTVLIGSRSIASVAAGGSSTGTTVLTIPAGEGGNNYIVACANDTSTVADTNAANNCGVVPIAISGADLSESVSSVPTTAFSGDKLSITDTVTNVGLGAADWSIVRYYLSTSQSRGGVVIGSRTISSLAASASSGPVTTTYTIPTTTSGAFYVVACANDTNTVDESSTANNCVASPVNIYQTAKVVVVDPTKTADPYDATACGSVTAACSTIMDGVAKAKAGQTVLVFPGTYVEQVSITKNIDLVSVVKNQAIIQAPEGVKLTPDADNLQVLLTVTGGASSVNIKDMTIAGPIFADSCSDMIYGIFVKNANANITGNKIDSIQQADPGLWGCQPGVGIRFGSRALGYIAHQGTISGNTVTAPAKGGIVVDGDGTTVNVTGNTVTGLNVIGVVGQNGIQISRNARGVVDSNKVSGFRYGDTLNALSAAGILVYDVSGSIAITNNTVSGNDEGIAVYSADTSKQNATKTTIKYNDASNNVYLGIHIDPFSTGNTIWNNTVKGNDGGWDELDEHPDFNSNDWGSTPEQYNSIGTAHAGLVFSY